MTKCGCSSKDFDLSDQICWQCAFKTLNEASLTVELSKLRAELVLARSALAERDVIVGNLHMALRSSAASMVTAIDRIQELEKIFQAARVVIATMGTPGFTRPYKTLVEIVEEQQRRIESRS